MTAMITRSPLSPAAIQVRRVVELPTNGTDERVCVIGLPDDGVHPSVTEILHTHDQSSISDGALVADVGRLIETGALSGQAEFEEVLTRIVTTAHPDVDAAWTAFYRNSLTELVSGTSDFAPVHRRARSLITGSSVLEVGSCFGFFALQCAEAGFDVTACDITPGTVELLNRVAPRLDRDIDAVVGDALDLPFEDRSIDTVTLIHLLEHLRPVDALRAVDEALRVARHRVVVAVPFEDEPSEHYGHLVRLTDADLHGWARYAGQPDAEVFSDHGGWLILSAGGAS
ncbi:mycofactocin oligosaccharide methyltransferase MftM [Gordonia soli]|uniref:Methyltransferase type 11 domain-containing protein n=1 Tax=Gordonia soli NBRC 108243 TaxID=1223545 RepID=M0QQX5_9ACTN|nr:mycofactocin oligosaccharide methyltransferase MftM [Gordonia soli]GAC70671.1 hypothetical protein GS4_39_00010 [Gordonia soli NBRC 108243]